MVIEKYWADIAGQDHPGQGKERIMEIPLSIPYLGEDVDFRATNVQFEKNGQTFRAIKQRYTEEALQIVYVPDTAKNNLNLAVRQWVNSLTQDGLPSSGHGMLFIKMFAKDYMKTESSLSFYRKPIQQQSLHKPYLFPYSDHFFDVVSPPPQFS